MEVTESARNTLTVEGGLPGWLGFFVLIPAFVALVLLLLWQPMSLDCVRGGDCTLEASGFFGAGTERFPAAGIRRAEVVMTRTSGTTATYRVVLDLTSGAKPLSALSTSERAEVAAEAKQINDWVAGQGGARLLLARDEPWLLGGAIGMALLGLGLTYFVPRRYHTVFDGQAREIRQRKTWLGLGGERRVAYDDVGGVDLRPFCMINGRQWMRATVKTAGRPLVLGYGPDDGGVDDQLARIREAL